MQVLEMAAARSNNNTDSPEEASDCGHCANRMRCWSAEMPSAALHRMGDVVVLRRKVTRGQVMQRQGSSFAHVMVVRSGMVKTSVFSSDGREQVTGFHLAGDFIGLDGLAEAQHACEAVALRDGYVCLLHFASLEALAQEYPPLQRQLYRLMAAEMQNKRQWQLLFASLAATRLAGVLVNLSQRLQARGLPHLALDLPMTRKDIGSLVGLTLESVSRGLAKLAAAHIVEVRLRQVHILNWPALEKLQLQTP